MVSQVGHDYALGPIEEALEHIDPLGYIAVLILLLRGGLLLAASLRYHDPRNDNVGVLNTQFSWLGRLTALIGDVVFVAGIGSPSIGVLALWLVI